MKSKKLLTIFFVIICIIACSFALVACGDKGTEKSDTQSSDYVVTIHPNNGGDNIIWKADCVFPTIEYKGYELEGYYLDEQLTNEILKTSIDALQLSKLSKNIDIYVGWKINYYDIKYDLGDRNSTNKAINNANNPTTYTVEDEITFAEPTRNGYTFKGWSVEKIVKGTIDAVNVKANWEIEAYNITYVLNDGTNDESNPSFLTIENLPLTLKNAIRTNYTFLGWYSENNTTSNKITTISESKDITIYAQWEYGTEGLQYTVSNDKYTVSGYSGNATKLIIPATHLGKNVTAIKSSAFSNKNITEVIIGENITSIGSYAFSYCSNLKNIVIPNNVTSIENGAFCGCSGVTSITVKSGNTKYHSVENCLIETLSKTLVLGGMNSAIPTDGSVTSIGSSAFYECNGLTSIEIPNSVTSIGSSAFYECNGLTSIEIPNSVTSIGSRAFYGCSCLTSIEIPNSVTSIGECAFSRCSGVTSIAVNSENAKYHSVGNCLIETSSKTLVLGCMNSVIPTDGSVTSIGRYAFSECNGLTSIEISDSVKTIENYAFEECSGLTSLTIGSGVTSIGSRAFDNCYKLVEIYNKSSFFIEVGSEDNGYVGYYAKEIYTSDYASKITNNNGYIIYDGTILLGYNGTETELEIPSNITEINRYAFYECSSLTSIKIPNTVTNIGEGAFTYCWRLTSLNIPSSVISINDRTFGACYGLTNVVIPNGVKSIGAYAFYACIGLTNIEIPKSVTSIGEYAFAECYKLVEVYNKSSLKITTESEDNGYVGYYAKNVYTTESGSKITNENGYIIYDGTILLGYNGTETELVIPSGITSIRAGAFFNFSDIISIEIPKSVKSIEELAFYRCSNLTSIKFSGSIAEWNAITKGYEWNYDTGAYTITCSDGVL